MNTTDLKAYIHLLNSQNPLDVGLEFAVANGFYQAVQTCLLSRRNRIFCFRGIGVRRFYSQLAKKGILAPVKVKVHPFAKGYAYMLDKGEVHLLSRLLFGAGRYEFVSVILHETAHLLLSQTPGYGELLQLDLHFAQTYLKGQRQELLKTVTPVEFYAQAITVQWVGQLAESFRGKKQDSLNTEREKMVNKLNAAIALLNRLSFS